MIRRYLLAIGLALLDGAPLSADEYLMRGPIELANVYPLSNLHLSHRPGSPALAPDGKTYLRAFFAHSNTAVLTSRTTVDAESRDLSLSLRSRLASRLEGELEIPLTWRGGGFTDTAIENWHDTFGLPEGAGERLPEDDFLIAGENRSGGLFALGDDGSSLGSVKTHLKYALLGQESSGEGRGTELAFKLVASLPTARASFGHDGLDLSGGLLGSYTIGGFGVYAAGSYLYYANPEVAGIDFDAQHVEGSLHLEYSAWSWGSLQAGFTGGDNAIEVSGHDGHSVYLDVGSKLAVSDSSVLEILVRENPWSGYGSADVTLLAGISVGL